MPAARTSLALLAATAAALTLAGCASTVRLEPAPEANDPACAEVSVRLPGTLDGQHRRWTDAQSTGAWGDPSAVILTCGVPPPGPTEARCITIGGVDWIVDESEAPVYRVTSYGREPAVEVYIDNEAVSSNEVLDRLGPLVAGATEQTAQCVASDSVLPGS